MTEALLTGLLAGYGIAMPVGAMSVLIVTLSAQVSWRHGTAAALGVATADGLYALVAVVGGAAFAGVIAAVARPLRLVSAAVLVLIALRGLVTAVRAHQAPADRPSASGAPLSRTYTSMVGLTLLNPVTIVYFGALVVGRQAAASTTAASAVFVAAAFAASVSWQVLLASGGALLGRLLTGDRGRLAMAVLGNSVILLLAVRLAWTAMA
ncbi:LysE family transporter [Streptomyces paromomycinus]|uniref:Lysine transporter LysE n=1 Tax=Streptomyces paromomycinus TaxID=92743 RepID=A0A401VVN3_STREY|nr:LysE family transporter [Streptomyces paromomycinus]GCD41134.1 lysine transporter LysE [Streptomyces paromomycinus]